MIVGSITGDQDLISVTPLIKGNDTVYVNEALVLDGGDSIGNGGIYNYTWTVDDEKYYGPVLTLVFEKAGEYNITLTVFDQYGLRGDVTIEIRVMEREEVKKESEEKEDLPMWILLLVILSALMAAAILFQIIRNRDKTTIEE